MLLPRIQAGPSITARDLRALSTTCAASPRYPAFPTDKEILALVKHARKTHLNREIHSSFRPPAHLTPPHSATSTATLQHRSQHGFSPYAAHQRPQPLHTASSKEALRGQLPPTPAGAILSPAITEGNKHKCADGETQI